MSQLTDSVSTGVPTELSEVISLGRTLTKRAVDVLAYLTGQVHPTGRRRLSTDAWNLRGTALGFRNLTNYIARSLLESGGFRPQLHPRL